MFKGRKNWYMVNIWISATFVFEEEILATFELLKIIQNNRQKICHFHHSKKFESKSFIGSFRVEIFDIGLFRLENRRSDLIFPKIWFS